MDSYKIVFPWHCMNNVLECLKKEKEDLDNALEFAESHSRLFKSSDSLEKIEMMKLYQGLCSRAINDISCVLHCAYEKPTFVEIEDSLSYQVKAILEEGEKNNE